MRKTVGVLLALGAPMVIAAEHTVPAELAAQRKLNREEITVTARKREESLQEVPLSITALTAEQLRSKNIQSGYDVAQFTPNFNYTRNLGRRLDAPTIRGQFSPLISDTEPNASFFIDGVYVPQDSAGNISIENLERVEVLRGPQAALLGRATFAGAVNYITRAPTDEFEGELNLKWGENRNRRVSAWASGPLIGDSLLFFASGNLQRRDGEWRNNLPPGIVDASRDPFTSQDPFFGPFWWQPNPQQPGTPPCPVAGPGDPVDPLYPGGCPSQAGDNSPLGGERNEDVTLKLVYRATDRLEFMVKAQLYQTDDEHIPSLRLPISRLNCFRPPDVESGFAGDGTSQGLPVGAYSPGWFCGKADVTGLSTVINMPHMRQGVQTLAGTALPAQVIGAKEDGELYTAQGMYDLNDWSFTARYTDSDIDSRYGRDLDRSYSLGPAASGLFESYEENFVDDSSFEFRVSSPPERRLRGLFGFYRYDREQTDFQRDFTGFTRERLTERFTKLTRNKAVFGSVEYDLNAEWRVALDARYAADRIRAIAAVNPADAGDPCNIDPAQCKDEAATFYSFTPRLTLSWQPADDLNFYALAAKGNKPGGFNTDYFDTDSSAEFFRAALGSDCNNESFVWQRANGPDLQLKPGCAKIEEEEAWTYELGAKTVWLDGRLTANLAVFYIDWESQAINVLQNILIDQGLELNLIVDNAGASSVRGAEAELSLLATDYLSLDLNYGFADTELEEYNSDEFALLTGIDDPNLVNDGNVSGHESPRAPRHTLSASALYMRPLSGDLSWFVRGDYSFSSRQWATVSNFHHTGTSNILNLRFGLETERWTATFYLDNVLDEDAPTLIQQFPLLDISKVATTAPIQTTGNLLAFRLQNPANGQAVYPSGFQYTPRYGTNWGVLFGLRF